MTTALPKLAGFAGALALLFGGGALMGSVVDANPPNASAETASAHQEAGAMEAMKVMPVRGLGVAENGLRLVVERTLFERGRAQQLSFHIVDDNGARVRDFDVEHTKRMHLIVVRHDLTGFQHLHPVEDGDGNWSVQLTLDAAGSYRMFADFSHDNQPTTLASDLIVNGTLNAVAMPPPAEKAASDRGYQVLLRAFESPAGEERALRFRITKNGKPVNVEPYLGADGHLVALRQGDLAFLHVHPTGTPTAADDITFDATFPTTGRYRLFFQFKADGKVHTAAFTQVVG
jgi:hypothetical protein